MKLAALLLLSVFCAFAAAPPGVDALIAGARTAPGEFAADSLIRIAALGTIERDRRLELLGLAFQRASAAQQPYKRIAALVRVQGPVGFLNRVYSQDLDALSLRLRAVEAMLLLDAPKSRALFAQIPDLKIPRPTCDDFLVYDVNRYYDVLTSLLRDADAAEGLSLLRRTAAAVTSPVQLIGMARVLTGADVPDAGFQAVIQAFATAMSRINGDDRSFTYSRGVGLQVAALVEECKRRKISPLPLLESYRVYLVFNLSSSRCADNDLMQGGGIQTVGAKPSDGAELQAADFAGFFNEKLRMAPLQPIHELESTPTRLEGAASGLRTCQDPKCKEIASLYQGLVFGAGNFPIPPAQRNTPEWQKKLQNLIDSLNAWKSSTQDSPLELFRSKAAAYGDLLNLATAGPGRERVARSFVEFLELNPIQKTHRLEWFLAVNGLIARMSLDPLGYAQFAEEMRKSKDPVIALYAALEAVAPRSADRILSLL